MPTSGAPDAGRIQLVNDIKMLGRLPAPSRVVPLLLLLLTHGLAGFCYRRFRIPASLSVGSLRRTRWVRATTIFWRSPSAMRAFLWSRRTAPPGIGRPHTFLSRAMTARAWWSRRSRRPWWFRTTGPRRRGRRGLGLGIFKRQGTLGISWSACPRCTAGRPACRAPARVRVPEAEGRTKISSAVSDGLLSADMLSETDRFELLDQFAWFWFAMAGSRNGLRESGRGGGSSKGEAGLCDAVGDTALLRLRKGLFEGRLRSNSAGRRSKW